MVDKPHRRKVWLKWHDEDAAKVMTSHFFGGSERR